MPRDKDDDSTRRPAKRPVRDVEPAESGPWKALGILFGCVAVAFAGIMIFVMAKAPKADAVAGDPPGDTGNPVKPPSGNQIPKGTDDPKPDGWTPPKVGRYKSRMAGRPSFHLKVDETVPPLTVGWVREGAYLRGQYVFAVTSDNKFAGDNRRDQRPLPAPPDLKDGDGLGNVSATAGDWAVFAKSRDRVFRYSMNDAAWASAPLAGYGTCLAVSLDHFLMVESRVIDTQIRLYRWVPGESAVTLSAKWEVAGGVAAATYDGVAGVLFVARAKDWNAEAGDLDRFALTGRGGTLLGSTRLPFKVGTTSRPVLSPDGSRAYVEDRAVEADRLLPITFPGRVVAAVGDFALIGNGEFADANTGQVVGKAWDKLNLSAFAFAADQSGCWAYDFTAKTYRRYGIFDEKLTTGSPTVDPKLPTVDPKPPPANPFATFQVTELASLPAPDRALLVFRHSDKHDLLMYADLSGTTILDTKTGTALPMPKLEGKARLRSADITPDQTALFASDGQNLHRLDLATRKWESRPNVGTRVLALDGSTVLVQVKPSSPATFAVVRWEQTKVTESSRLEWPYLYELGYDPSAKALYALQGKVNNSGEAVIEKYGLKDAAFVSEWSKKSAGAVHKLTFRPLTGDGKYFYQGQRAWDTTSDDRGVTQYSEPLVGATRNALVGASGKLYAAGNVPARIGTLPQPIEAVSASTDGQTVWAHSRAAKKFIRYKFEPGPSEKK